METKEVRVRVGYGPTQPLVRADAPEGLNCD